MTLEPRTAAPSKPGEIQADTIVGLLQMKFHELSPRLRKAARFAIDNPEEIAVHSMRSIAKRAGVHHNAMLRLARMLDFQTYDEFRDEFRNIVTTSGRQTDWLHRARTIRADHPGGPDGDFVQQYVVQETANLEQTFGEQTMADLAKAASLIEDSRRMYVVGLRSMFPVAYYFHYVCRMFAGKSVLLTGLGGSFADDLRNVEESDVVVVFSYQPYTKDAVKAVRFARSRGAKIVAITDSLVSPVITAECIAFIVNNNSKSLFPTLLPAFALAQVLATLLVSQGSEDTLAAIARSQEQLDDFGVYFD